MTPKPKTAPPDAVEIIRFPDHPNYDDMSTFNYLLLPALPQALIHHFGNRETTIVTSELAARLTPTETLEGVLYPDLLIAFNADPAAHFVRNGYTISEQGKPPDFVMEVASKWTSRRDEVVKRDAYAEMGVSEYWRFDPTRKFYRDSPLSGDTLAEARYEPIPIRRVGKRDLIGHSAVLSLDLCWEDGQLRFWDPFNRRYLATYDEILERGRVAEAAYRTSEAARSQAETRVRQLEEQLHLLDPESH